MAPHIHHSHQEDLRSLENNTTCPNDRCPQNPLISVFLGDQSHLPVMDAANSTRDDLLSKDELSAKFGAGNYVVFFLMLLVSAVIGVFYWWKGNKTTEDFLLAGRSMSTIPMTLSLAASFMSAITLLGVPAEVYTAGTQYSWMLVALPFVMMAVIYLYLPVYDKLKLTTSYEYLELRFCKSVRMIASFFFCLQMVLYMAIVVYAPALALIQVTGFLNGIKNDIEIACFIIFLVCIFYSSIGGMKAVMWTDTFQAICMIASFLGIIIYGSEVAGGPGKVFDLNYQVGRVELFNFDPDMRQRHTVWSVFIGSFFLWLSVYATNQAQVQRYASVKKKSQVVTALWLNCVFICFLIGICCYAGMVVFAYYHDCDPIKAKQVRSKDQMFPLFVMQVVGDVPAVPGLFVAGVFSGALSTVSSGLNSLAAVAWTDFLTIADMMGKPITISDQKKTLITKGISVVLGLISFAVVFVVKYVPGVLHAAIAIFGMVGGPILGVFSLGMFVPFANTVGALTGLLSSLIFVFWWGFGFIAANFSRTYNRARFSPLMPTTTENCPAAWLPDPVTTNATITAAAQTQSNFTHLGLYDVSYMWFGPVSCLICFLIGCLVSLHRPADHKTMDPRLISRNIIRLGKFLTSGLVNRLTGNRIHNYLDEVGSQNENANIQLEQKKDIGMNGAINGAFVAPDMKFTTKM